MLAIHNNTCRLLKYNHAANAFAKLSKCQQFTTVGYLRRQQHPLQTLLQSYQNVSNSQLGRQSFKLQVGCKRFCKVIKMLAIHNLALVFFCNFMLQTLLQSYQNVSNSQLSSSMPLCQSRCKRFCKVIKMLAIHNPLASNKVYTAAANAFAKLSKCQQFTTRLSTFFTRYRLQTLLQSYQNVSNSQQRSTNYIYQSSCKRFCKVIKMLAIHNNAFEPFKIFDAANAFAKLSKCQQFTTHLYQLSLQPKLQTLLQSYQNVSNSQQVC